MWSENGTGRDTTSLSSYRLHFTSSQLFLWLCPVPSVSVTLTLHLVPSVLRSCVVRPTGLRSATLRSVKDRRERTEVNDEWNDWKKRGTDAAPLHRSFIACGSLTPLVLRVFRRHFIPPVFIILRTPRSALRAAKRPPGSRLRREWSECSEGTRGVTESTEGPDCYQRLEFFIQVLRVLCPNLTDASLVVCVVSLPCLRRFLVSFAGLSLGSLPSHSTA